MKANVPESGCAQQGVADGMQEHIRITVAQATFVIRDPDPADP